MAIVNVKTLGSNAIQSFDVNTVADLKTELGIEKIALVISQKSRWQLADNRIGNFQKQVWQFKKSRW